MSQHGKSHSSPFDEPDLFVSVGKDQQQVREIQKTVRKIIQDSYPEIELLRISIEDLGIPVIHQGPEMQIKLSAMMVGAQPGFVPPTLTKYDDFIKSICKYCPARADMDFSGGLLLVLREDYHFASLAYHFYHAMAYRAGLQGYQDKALKLYATFNRKYNSQLNPQFLEKLDLEESTLLKLAIRRDREALQFVRHILNEVYIPVNNARLIEKGKAQA